MRKVPWASREKPFEEWGRKSERVVLRGSGGQKTLRASFQKLSEERAGEEGTRKTANGG